MTSKEPLMIEARDILINAINHDKAGRKKEAIKAYGDGVEIMLKLKSTSNLLDENDHVILRQKIDQYMSRAESLRNDCGQTVDVKYLEQRRIEENSKGNSYESIFGKCLDDELTEVTVEDPYITVHHQICNFVMFCELLVSKCSKLKKINLITGENSMQNAFKELKISLQISGVELNLNFYEFHDREIRFNNGWLVKIGRGLDIYKPVGKYTIGSQSFNLRPCKKTIVDIFKCA